MIPCSAPFRMPMAFALSQRSASVIESKNSISTPELAFQISLVMQGKRKKKDQDEWIPCILEPEGSSKEYRKNWARLIQKIYEVDPLMCPKCQGRMKIIAFIEDEEVIEKILKHLGLWDLKVRPPPRAKTPSVTIYLDDSESQILSPDSFYIHPDYPMDSYVSRYVGRGSN